MKMRNGLAELTLDAADGRIAAFAWDGEKVALPAERLFLVGLRDAAGNLHEISSSDMPDRKISHEESEGCRWSFSNQLLEVAVTIRRWKNDGFCFRTEVALRDEKQWFLEWIDSPQVVVNGKLRGRGGEGLIFSPIHEGMLFDDPRLREENSLFAYKRMGYPNTGWNGYYPGSAQMQFTAYYTDRAGVYFGAHDSTHTTKAVEFENLRTDLVRLSLQTFCGSDAPGRYAQPFDIVLAGFHGDWMDAAAIYREWAWQDPHLPVRLKENRQLPEWVADSPITLIYPVRGDGDDKGELLPNEYFPYVKALPVVERYAKELDSRIMALLMHWEGTAPWAPPYVWPPFGGEAALAEFRDKLHAKNHLLGVYCSGTAWTQTSSIIDYSCEELCERENLRSQMSRGPKGEIDAFICNGPKGVGQRRGFDCCIGQEWTHETVRNEVLKLADFGVDYAQYFDQNLGGSAHFCYSKEHHHPPMPGQWQTEAMLRLVQEIDAELQKRGSRMLIGCEAAAAQPYLKYMKFSDLRYTNTFQYGAMPVPAYAFVFHEYVCNFQGNQGGFQGIDYDRSPENLLFRTAYSFIAGDLLAMMLKDHGEFHWRWVMKWDQPAPEQQPVRTLLRNLNTWRRKAGREFLLFGRMEKPFFHFQAPQYILPSRIAGRKFVTSTVLSSAWRAQNGDKAQFLVNFMPREQQIEFEIPSGSQAAMVDAEGRVQKTIVGKGSMPIPVLQAVMLQFPADYK